MPASRGCSKFAILEDWKNIVDMRMDPELLETRPRNDRRCEDDVP
jgi:hypothetical protein